MSEKCANCDCADKSRCPKKGGIYDAADALDDVFVRAQGRDKSNWYPPEILAGWKVPYERPFTDEDGKKDEPKPDPKEVFRKHLCTKMKKYKMTDKNEIAAFLANSDHETGGGKDMYEDINYSLQRWREIASRQRNVREWLAKHPKNTEAEFKKLSSADKLNIMYKGKNGNKLPDDGYRFRGRGGMHITGRDTYQKFADFVKKPEIMSNPDLVAEDMELAAESAVWYWKYYKPGLAKAAREKRFDDVRKTLNGGNIGKDERNDKFSQYLKGKGSLSCG